MNSDSNSVIDRLWTVLAGWRGEIMNWAPYDDEPVRGICHACRTSPFRDHLGVLDDAPHRVTHTLHELLEKFVTEWEFLAPPGKMVMATRAALAEAMDCVGDDIAHDCEVLFDAERFALIRDAAELVGVPADCAVGPMAKQIVADMLQEWFEWISNERWKRAASVPAGRRCELCTTSPVILPDMSITVPHAVFHKLRALLHDDLDEALEGYNLSRDALQHVRPRILDQIVVAIDGDRPRIEHALRLYVAEAVERDIAETVAHLHTADG